MSRIRYVILNSYTDVPEGTIVAHTQHRSPSFNRILAVYFFLSAVPVFVPPAIKWRKGI